MFFALTSDSGRYRFVGVSPNEELKPLITTIEALPAMQQVLQTLLPDSADQGYYIDAILY
jgi:hypothetical protein